MNEINYSKWCQVLSTQGHHECRRCDCTCHETGAFGGINTTPKRPHSFPRPDWEMGLRPRGWQRAQSLRKAQEQQEKARLGLV